MAAGRERFRLEMTAFRDETPIEVDRARVTFFVGEALKKIHKGGFYHDGRFATLQDVVNHYDRFLKLKLSEAQKRDLIEYLKSI